MHCGQYLWTIGRCRKQSTHKIDTDDELSFAPLGIGFRCVSSIVRVLTAYHGLLWHVASILLLLRRCLHGVTGRARHGLLAVHVLRRVGRKVAVRVLGVDWRRRHGARRTASHLLLLLLLQLLLLLSSLVDILVRGRATQRLLAGLGRAMLLRRVLVRVHCERGGRDAGLLVLLDERVVVVVVVVVVLVAIVPVILALYTLLAHFRPHGPPSLPEEAHISPEQMIEQARQKMGMDCVHMFNFGIAGASGAGTTFNDTTSGCMHACWPVFTVLSCPVLSCSAELANMCVVCVDVCYFVLFVVGKSALVNAFRGLPDVDVTDPHPHDPYGSAPVGEKETTQEPKMYRFSNPELNHIAVWDLPGHPPRTTPHADVHGHDMVMVLTWALYLH